MPAPAHIETRGLSVGRGGTDLVAGLDLSLPRGTFAAITGPSAVGKTSLLACLAGLLAPREGSISYRCLAGCTHKPAGFRKRLGIVFQHLRLASNASAATNVLCGLLAHRSSLRTLLGFSRRDHLEAGRLLDRLGIARLAPSPVKRLSGGERQRVAVARALISRPEVVLADEPVAAMDEPLARDVLGLLRESAEIHGTTVVCVLHDERLVEEFATLRIRLSNEAPGAWHVQPAAQPPPR